MIATVDDLRDGQVYRLPSGLLVMALHHVCVAVHDEADEHERDTWMLVAAKCVYCVDRTSGGLYIGQLQDGGEPIILPDPGLPTPFALGDLELVERS